MRIYHTLSSSFLRIINHFLSPENRTICTPVCCSISLQANTYKKGKSEIYHSFLKNIVGSQKIIMQEKVFWPLPREIFVLNEWQLALSYIVS